MGTVSAGDARLLHQTALRHAEQRTLRLILLTSVLEEALSTGLRDQPEGAVARRGDHLPVIGREVD